MGSLPTKARPGLLFWWTPLHPTLSGRHHIHTRNRMPHTTTTSVRRALAVLLIGLPACGGELVLPEVSDPGQVIGEISVRGDEQTGPVGERLVQPLVVQVLTRDQEPAEGVEVSFELGDPAGGSLTPTTVPTNSAGEAVANWTLGTVPGSYVAVARLVGVEGQDTIAQFHAGAHAGPPDTLSSLIPLDQPGIRQQEVGETPVVRVVDRFGNPVPGVPVAWQVTAGEGHVTSSITTTDADGKASVQWTLGNRLGVHKLTASVESSTGSPVTFTAWVYL